MWNCRAAGQGTLVVFAKGCSAKGWEVSSAPLPREGNGEGPGNQ